MHQHLIWVVATQTLVIFTPILGEMIQLDSYFSDELKHRFSGTSVMFEKRFSNLIA